jgi:preprotein translocase subunit SecD
MAPRPQLIAARVDGPLKLIYLHTSVIVTDKDIVSASVSKEPSIGGYYDVRVVFTKRGADRMAAATKPERGLLAVLVDGKVVAAMGIPAQIHDKAAISGPMTKTQAEDLAAILKRVRPSSN